jgi:hypothetical protein
MTTEKPSVLGKIDKKAIYFSSSHILWHGTSPFAILQKIQSVME